MPSLLQLEECQCRFPITNDTPFLFCGRKKRPGSSYCQRHHTICTSGEPKSLLPLVDFIHRTDGTVAPRSHDDRAAPIDGVLK